MKYVYAVAYQFFQSGKGVFFGSTEVTFDQPVEYLQTISDALREIHPEIKENMLMVNSFTYLREELDPQSVTGHRIWLAMQKEEIATRTSILASLLIEKLPEECKPLIFDLGVVYDFVEKGDQRLPIDEPLLIDMFDLRGIDDLAEKVDAINLAWTGIITVEIEYGNDGSLTGIKFTAL